MNGVFFNKKDKLPCERIKAVALEKVSDNEYMLVLEKKRCHYENYYLWKYILRDMLLSVLVDFDVCFCVEESNEKGNLKQDFGMYECKEDGDNICFFCHDITAYITTTLLEEYENIWEYDGSLHFYAKIKGGDERTTKNLEYQVKISSLKDSLGLYIVSSDTFEGEMIKRIEKVANSYKLRLIMRGKCDD